MIFVLVNSLSIKLKTKLFLTRLSNDISIEYIKQELVERSIFSILIYSYLYSFIKNVLVLNIFKHNINKKKNICMWHNYALPKIIDIEYKYISNEMFKRCMTLQKIYFKNTEVIEEEAFSRCYNIKKIICSKNLKYIKTKAFYECINLETVVLPKEIIKIEQYAFQKCINLKRVIFI